MPLSARGLRSDVRRGLRGRAVEGTEDDRHGPDSRTRDPARATAARVHHGLQVGAVGNGAMRAASNPEPVATVNLPGGVLSPAVS